MRNLNYYFLIIFIILISRGINAQETSGELMGLIKIQEGIKSRRISSYNQSGKNADFIGNREEIISGETRTIFDVQGAGIINHIWITIFPSPEEFNRNDIILRMYWDGKDFPSVEAPLGAFFGQGWDEAYEFASLPLAAGPKNGMGLVCYFAMPFAKGAKIEIENQNDSTMQRFYYYIDYIEMKILPENLGRFHAWYNKELTEAQPQGEIYERAYVNKDGKDNYVVADIQGKGHFVGVNYYVNNPSPDWYGEGDDMIFIDGDETPTLHGTGTEDYFNTAWGPNSIFLHPYYGYARVNDNIGYLGRTHCYRFHINDPIYFDKSLKFTFEHGHANAKTLEIATVAYWYQDTASPVPSIPDKEARQSMRLIHGGDIYRWRHEWRKSKGEGRQLWGIER